jgi:hypothetical protein
MFLKGGRVFENGESVSREGTERGIRRSNGKVWGSPVVDRGRMFGKHAQALD